MSQPDTEQIRRMVAELDAAVSREGARMHLLQYGGGPDESKVVGNQRGYLRLGIEFLRAAFASPSHKFKDRIDADVGYLLTDDSDIGFDWFERREDLAASEQAEQKPSRFAPAIRAIVLISVMLVLISGLLLAIIGLGTVISWMRR